MKILCFKFDKNRTINEEFDFFEGEGPPGGKRASIHRFLSYLFLVNISICYVSNLIKTAQFMKNFTFLRGRGAREVRGLPFIHFYLNYFW